MEKEGIEVESDQTVNRQLLYAEEMFGSAALVVIGEPTSEEHKNAILERVAHGKKSISSAFYFFCSKKMETDLNF